MPTYVRYELEDGGEILVETSEPEGGLVKASRSADGNSIVNSGKKFSEALQNIKASARAVMQEFADLHVDSASIKFGLKTTGEAGILAVGKMSGEVNYEVTLNWSKPKDR